MMGKRKSEPIPCGLDLEKLSDLPANLEKLVGVKLEVTVIENGEEVS